MPSENQGILAADLVEIHGLIDIQDKDTYIEAANLALDRWMPSERVHSSDNAITALVALYRALLEAERYGAASLLCWGGQMFDPRPYFVRKVWKVLRTQQKFLIMGCAAGGKSFNVYVFDLHDFNRDPWYTTTKIISTTAGHAKAQAMSTIVRLHRESVIPMPGYILQGFLGMDKDNLRSSISELAIDKGSELEGKSSKLQGFHPYQRKERHPTFGIMSRVKARLEECEDIPVAVWPGITNMMATAGGGNVSAGGMFNPKRRDSAVAQRAEPEGGWVNFDIEKSEEWVSKEGFFVLRLDGAKCENVIERRIVYPGLIDFDGFNQHDPSKPDHYTFSRGAYPLSVATYGIVDPIILDQRKGVLIWQRHPTPLAALDMAEEGGDEAIYTAARYGPAVAFEPELAPEHRSLILSDPRNLAVGIASKYNCKFEHVMVERDRVRIVFEQTRWAIQLDQQFPLQKKNTVLMGADVIKMCQLLHVKPEWFGLDCTNSVTLRDWMRLEWGIVQGFKWGEGASDMPILEEDQEKASDLFTNLKTEMWFAMGAWVEFGYVAFAPSMETDTLFNDLAGMRYRQKSKTMKECMPTKEFKKQFGGRSPDRGASAVQCIQVVRRNSSQVQRPQMGQGIRRGIEPDVVYDPRRQEEPFFSESTGAADVLKWVH